MELDVHKAKRSLKHLKLALGGLAGAGKTMTALEIMKGLGAKSIILLDSEHRSAERHYGDAYDFDTADLNVTDEKPLDPFVLAGIIRKSAETYDGIIVDSVSHSWLKLVSMVDEIADRMPKSNSFAAWRHGTPRQNEMLRAIMYCKAHLILTLRLEEKYELQKNAKGKLEVQKLGLRPIQRKNFANEVDVYATIAADHSVTIEKARDPRGLLQSKTFATSDELVEALRAWLK